MQKKQLIIFASLCFMFLTYSFSIYLQPLITPESHDYNSIKGGDGRLVWQKYNCQACHQLYGLGGYLGPDLTNVYSKKGKGEVYIRAMIASGTAQMPNFSLNENEFSQLIEFLKMTDASGTSDPRNFKIEMNGMISKK